jgi:hypothetical protein
MKKEITIKVPTKWDGVALGSYLNLLEDLKTYGDDENAYVACLFHHLCGFDPQYINQLPLETYTAIREDILAFMNNTQLPLQKIIEIDGVEYGFEPNLAKIAYGAYLDIANYDTFKIDDNWAKIMSILYRPIKKKAGKLYEIESYKGEIDGEKFMKVTMDIHFGALFFFVRLLTALPSATLKSLKDMENLPHNIKSILEKSGETIQHSSNSPEEISDIWMKLLNTH